MPTQITDTYDGPMNNAIPLALGYLRGSWKVVCSSDAECHGAIMRRRPSACYNVSCKLKMTMLVQSARYVSECRTHLLHPTGRHLNDMHSEQFGCLALLRLARESRMAFGQEISILNSDKGLFNRDKPLPDCL
jgi:hypothetical protein